jgi:TPR repeat protein
MNATLKALAAATLLASSAWSASASAQQAAPANEAAPVAMADDTYVGTVQEAWENGRIAYAEERYWEAYGYLFSAAMRDHAEAQEMVGMMKLHGQEMFGSQITRDRDEAIFWLSEAARRGRTASLRVVCALTQRQSLATLTSTAAPTCRLD